jgi:hypothetical protein
MSEDEPRQDPNENQTGDLPVNPASAPQADGQPHQPRRGSPILAQRLVVGIALAAIMVVLIWGYIYQNIVYREQLLSQRPAGAVPKPVTRTPTLPPPVYTKTARPPLPTNTPMNHPFYGIYQNGDMVVALRSYYIDRSGITVNFDVTGLDHHPNLVPAVWLMDSDGQVFSLASVSRQPPDPQLTVIDYEAKFYPQVTYIDASGTYHRIDHFMNTVDYAITLQFITWFVDNTDAQTGEIATLNAMTPGPNSIGPFKFEYTVRVNP